MIPYISSSITKYHVRVVAIIQDSRPFDIKGQRILKPEMVGCGVLPSARRVPVKSMDCDDTGGKEISLRACISCG